MFLPSAIDSVLTSIKSECDFLLQLFSEEGSITAVVVADPEMEKLPKSVEAKLAKAGFKPVETEHGFYYLYSK
jgi:hypothetical protein